MIAKLLKILNSILALFKVPLNPLSTVLVMSLIFSHILFMLLMGFEQNGVFVFVCVLHCFIVLLVLFCFVWFCVFGDCFFFGVLVFLKTDGGINYCSHKLKQPPPKPAGKVQGETRPAVRACLWCCKICLRF